MGTREEQKAERDLAQLQEEILFGKEFGQILWQPRIGCWYNDKQFAGEELPGVFKGMTLPEVYRELGCAPRVYEYNGCFKAREEDTIIRESRWISDLEELQTIRTPVGEVSCIMKGNRSNGGRFPSKWWVEDEKDLKVMEYVLSHQTWYWDQEHFDSMKKKWGNLGAPTVYMPRVNIQYLYIDLMGVENAVFALADYPEQVEEFFEVLRQNQDQLMDVINASPIRIINFGDNLHGGTLPPYYFEKYVLPEYQRRCKKLHEGGKFISAHWDGDCKSLLSYAKSTGLDAIEAITPKPQGDVTLQEVKEALGDEMWLMDGIAAILFDETFSEEELIAQTEECIRLFAPRLILGISDELSSTGNIERIRLVKKIVDDYNTRIKADKAWKGQTL